MAVSTIGLVLISSSFIKNVTNIQYILIAVIGFCIHYFGFLVNDLFDLKYDQNSPSRRLDPLVQGLVSKRDLIAFAILQVIVVFIVIIILEFNIVNALTILSSCLLSIFYNKFGKRHTIPKILPELALALSIGILIFSIARLDTNRISINFILWDYLVILTLLQINAIANGLKDIKTDKQQNAINFVIQNKCKYEEYDKLQISARIKKFGYAIQFLIIILEIIQLLLYPSNIKGYAISSIIVSIIALWHFSKLMSVTKFSVFQRSSPFLYGYLNFCAIILLVLHQLDQNTKLISLAFILFIVSKPTSHFFNTLNLKYGRKS